MSSAGVNAHGAPHSRGFPPPLRSALAVSTTSTIYSSYSPAACFIRKRSWDYLFSLQSLPQTRPGRSQSCLQRLRVGTSGAPSRESSDHHAVSPSSFRKLAAASWSLTRKRLSPPWSALAAQGAHDSHGIHSGSRRRLPVVRSTPGRPPFVDDSCLPLARMRSPSRVLLLNMAPGLRRTILP